jgi:pimeloyl-ACP methyl ester carboxylesterase
MYRQNAISDVDIAGYARDYSRPGGMTAGFNYYRALLRDRQDAAPFQARRLEMPVLTIAGEHFIGPALGDSLRPQAPKLTALIAPASGHFVAEEASDFVHAELQKFLAGV